MTALDDLKAADDKLLAVATDAVNLLNQLFAVVNGTSPGIDPAAVSAEVDRINAAVASVQAAVTADTPAPVVVPTST